MNRDHFHYIDLRSVGRSTHSLTLKVKSVLPSFPRLSYVSPAFMFILQCVLGYPVCIHSLFEAARSRFDPGNSLPCDVMGLFRIHINCL